ncbi:hypothetical protein PTSG_10006 [Salpingoeca rosetta]|uniref:LTD domain-containing protein n=1 Tax=Salpingoeca rosetta (strain ATCC 50818 / BSB-021) TaxID=946362 RepID=F2UP87_SALR5|nr:uncharacterized protein PTSG_10006 [Salpingoeca rosetta]EGD79442.1 hypothetical protein PTSG_10006 [Salpingoeca rosetta]|eukprot:XP_004988923.1 hypothetical protein PTSG_10006 [Salpingoeca rosetta]
MADTASTPGSPQFRRRVKEREQLDELNNELAAYLVRVRELQKENGELTSQLEAIRFSRKRFESTATIKLEGQVNDLLEEIRRKTTEIGTLNHQVQDLRKQLNKTEGDALEATREKDDLAKQLNEALSKVQELEGQVSGLQRDVSQRDTTVTNLQRRVASLEADLGRQVDDTKRERLARLEAESRAQGLEDKLSSQDDMYQQQVTALEEQIKIGGTSGGLSEEDLEAALTEAKEHYKQAVNNFRTQMRSYFAQQPIIEPDTRGLEERARLQTEVIEWRSKYEDVKAQGATAQTEIEGLKSKLAGLEDVFAQIKKSHTDEIRHKEDFIFKLTKTMQDKDDLYRDLLDERIALDAEIDRYRRQLESALRMFEARSPGTGAPQMVASVRKTTRELVALSGRRAVSTKRRTAAQADGGDGGADGELGDGSPKAKMSRLAEEAHSFTVETNTQGALSVEDVDYREGQYILLKNTTASPLDLADWAVTVTNRDTQLGTFEFPAVTLAPGRSTRVIRGAGDGAEKLEGDVVWTEFPDLAAQPELAVYAFDPDDNESSTWAIMRD